MYCQYSLSVNKHISLSHTVLMFCTGKAHKTEGNIIPARIKGARYQHAHQHLRLGNGKLVSRERQKASGNKGARKGRLKVVSLDTGSKLAWENRLAVWAEVFLDQQGFL